MNVSTIRPRHTSITSIYLHKNGMPFILLESMVQRCARVYV